MPKREHKTCRACVLLFTRQESGGEMRGILRKNQLVEQLLPAYLPHTILSANLYQRASIYLPVSIIAYYIPKCQVPRQVRVSVAL
jgi:hypothetical protein